MGSFFSLLSSPSGTPPSVSFANLPAASTATGRVYRVADIGSGGTYFVSTGTIWRPLNGRAVLAASGVASPVTGTTALTTLASVAVPAGLMTPNGTLLITSFWSQNSNAISKTISIKLGSALLLGYGQTNSVTFRDARTVANRGVANSQVTHPLNALTAGVSTGSNTPVVTSVDTTQVQTLTFSGQLTDVGDTITLESYSVELIIP